MGYATIQHVQRIDEANHYAQAYGIWANTKPIRGNPDRNARPLGARRDMGEYHCAKDGLTGNITYYYCGTPVISFAPNGDVVICGHNGWTGHNQLIHRVLGIPAYIKNSMAILEIGGVKKIVNLKVGIRLVKGEDGNWQTTDTTKVFGYATNRKKTAEVKAEYKEFERFFKGFLNVQKMDRPVFHSYEKSFKCVPIHPSTLVELFGVEEKDGVAEAHLNIYKYREMTHKPYVNSRWPSATQGLEYFNASTAVAELITSNQSEDTKQVNFLKGAYLFCLSAASHSWYLQAQDSPKYAHLNKTLKYFNDFILFKYAEKIIDVVELPEGMLPNTKLAKVMKWHEQSDECEKLRKAKETQSGYEPTQTAPSIC